MAKAQRKIQYNRFELTTTTAYTVDVCLEGRDRLPTKRFRKAESVRDYLDQFRGMPRLKARMGVHTYADRTVYIASKDGRYRRPVEYVTNVWISVEQDEELYVMVYGCSAGGFEICPFYTSGSVRAVRKVLADHMEHYLSDSTWAGRDNRASGFHAEIHSVRYSVKERRYTVTLVAVPDVPRGGRCRRC